MVEAIDLVPTFVEAVGSTPAYHRLEGRALTPLLHGKPPDDWRDAVFSEIDFGFNEARRTLGLSVDEARAYMIRTERWKYIHYVGFAPQLFDLQNDPDEFHDLGRDADYEQVRETMHRRLFDRLVGRKNRVTITSEAADAISAPGNANGILIGVWDENS
jgi:arylsulfatase A-like enzyme